MAMAVRLCAKAEVVVHYEQVKEECRWSTKEVDLGRLEVEEEEAGLEYQWVYYSAASWRSGRSLQLEDY